MIISKKSTNNQALETESRYLEKSIDPRRSCSWRMAAPTKTTRKAWYCRKGRADRERIDRLIAARREREARIAQNDLKNHSYFSNWQRQSEWLSHSNHLLKSKASRIPKITVPYDLDYPLKSREDTVVTNKIIAKLREAKEKFKSKLVVFNELDRTGDKLRNEGDKLCYQVESLLALRKTLKDRQESFGIKEHKVFYCRFAKDRFRSKIFVVCEQLNYYKAIIECLGKSSSVEEYIGGREKEQLDLLISSSLEIINFFMKLYQQKNSELIPIYK